MCIRKICLITIGLSVGVFAASAYDSSESRKFVGLEVMASEVQGAVPGNAAFTQNALTYGIKIGAQNIKWRTAIAYRYLDKSQQNIESLDLIVDHFVGDMGKQALFRPYLGINLGYASYESIGITDSGFSYGAQGGVVASIMHNVQADLSYRYSVTGMDRYDHNTGLVFSIHYFY